MSRKNKKYGWIPDLPDQRSAHYPLAELEIALHVCSFSRLRGRVREEVGSHLYAAPQPVLAKLPKKVCILSNHQNLKLIRGSIQMNPLYSRILQNVLLVPIFAVLLLAACAAPYSTVRPLGPLFEEGKITGHTIPDGLAASGVSSADFMYFKFISALDAALKPQAASAVYQTLYDEGKGLIDYRCAMYFSRLGKIQQDLGYTRKETTLTGGLVSGMLGLANQTPKVIANTGAAFGFTAASMDSYQDAFLYSPDVGAIQQLVYAKMKKEGSAESVTSWGDATSRLAQHEQFCQPQGIRHLINESVINAAASGVSGK